MKEQEGERRESGNKRRPRYATLEQKVKMEDLGCILTRPQIVWGKEGAQRSERPTHGKKRQGRCQRRWKMR